MSSPKTKAIDMLTGTNTDRKQSTDVIVVGGGLIGLSSALHLARRGASVRILEAQYCGRHASGGNAGGVRTLGRHTAEIPLSLTSRDELWCNMLDLVGDDCGFQASGQLKIIENDNDLHKALARVQELSNLGFTHEVLIDQHFVRDLVPTISPHALGAIWVASDGHANPYRTVVAFRRAAHACGVAVHEHTPVTRIDMKHGTWHIRTGAGTYQSRLVVNAAGAWGAEISAQVDEPIPMEISGLMLMITQKVPPFVKPVLGTMSRPLSFKQFDNGSILIGGALRCPADASQRLADVDVNGLRNSARTAVDLFPHLRHIHLNRTWASLEGMLPDHIPIISKSGKSDGLVHAFGFSAHGFEMSPIVGRIVTQLLLDGSSPLPITPFSIQRFST